MGLHMTDDIGQVRPSRISKQDTSAALAAGWARECHRLGKGTFADLVGVDLKTINRALTGETLPEFHTALASLRASPTALDEVAALYDVEIRPRQSQTAQDFETIANLSRFLGRWVEALSDGRRDHRETLELGEHIRPLLPHLTALVGEADRLRATRTS